jgi:hypothetical protein
MLRVMAIPEPLRSVTSEQVERFCENRIPAHVRDQIRLDHVLRGNTVTIRELRPPWRPDYGPEWSINPRARLRFDPATALWSLYWPDRNTRWHVYPDAHPTGDVEWLLREIDVDPHCAFWG